MHRPPLLLRQYDSQAACVPLPYGCQCGARWGGLKTCHCAACHQSFTVLSAFDKHRRGSHPDSTRHCVDPASVGLIDVGRSYPCWTTPHENTAPWRQTNPAGGDTDDND